MNSQKTILVDVGMKDLPFPIKMMSGNESDGQLTVAGVSISAQLMREFEARRIDTFIHIVHQHRDRIGTETLAKNFHDYVNALRASAVTVSFEYPFFYVIPTAVMLGCCRCCS